MSTPTSLDVLNVLEAWMFDQCDIGPVTKDQYLRNTIITNSKWYNIIQDLKTDPIAVRERGMKEGWLK